MVEEIAATADLLSGQAQDLTGAVSTFKLGGENTVFEPLPQAPHPLSNPDARPALGEAALSDAEIARTIAETWREDAPPRMLPANDQRP
jgi:hypothetical protein